jgi:cytochrome P450
MIVASSWHEGRDKNIWNQGPNNEHSVEEFWAERFLVYPNDPTTGPRKPGTETKRTATKTASENNEPKFTADSVLGSFIPYGGGAKVCPGRFYAKHEALIGLALFIMMFDIELLGDKEIKPNMNYFPFGVVPPLGRFPARIRRRKI